MTMTDWEQTHKLGCTRCLEFFEDEVGRYLIKKGVYNFAFDRKKDLNTLIDQAVDLENFEGALTLQDLLDEGDDTDE